MLWPASHPWPFTPPQTANFSFYRIRDLDQHIFLNCLTQRKKKKTQLKDIFTPHIVFVCGLSPKTGIEKTANL